MASTCIASRKCSIESFQVFELCCGIVLGSSSVLARRYCADVVCDRLVPMFLAHKVIVHAF